MPKNILYIESNTDGTIGGSYFSLLFLIQRVNRNRYNPIVIFYRENDLLARYREAGCRVHIHTPRKPLGFVSFFKHKSPFLRILFPPAFVLQKIFNFFFLFLFAALPCYRFLRKESIDLVHLNNTVLRPQEWILASLFTKAKVVAHERGINTTFPQPYRFWTNYITMIFCISEAVRSNLIKHGFKKKRIALIYNGIDPDQFSPKRSKNEVLQELGIKTNQPIYGVIGNIKQWKGQEVAVRALEKVVEKYPEAICLLIGGCAASDRSYLEYLKNLVEYKEITRNIIFTGYQNDVPGIANVLDVVVHTSIDPEPFGRVLLEGMALRKPVITVNTGAGPEIVIDGLTGFVTEVGNSDELAQKICFLFADPDRAKRIGIEGYQRLLSVFHIEKNVELTEKAYSAVLGEAAERENGI